MGIACRLVTLDKAGNIDNMAQPEAFNRILKTFLE
jgi:hypothetical protein